MIAVLIRMRISEIFRTATRVAVSTKRVSQLATEVHIPHIYTVLFCFETDIVLKRESSCGFYWIRILREKIRFEKWMRKNGITK